MMVMVSSRMEKLIFSLLILGFIFLFTLSEAGQSVPGMYVFGDSLVDVGNNNHLKLSLAKADFPHNGVDYPTGKPTGRFNNGKNSADFLAEKVGLATSHPYLSLVKSNKQEGNVSFPISGVSFASGGAGIFNSTDLLFKQNVPLTKQIEYYTRVHENLVQQLGSLGAQNHLSKSLFVVFIGNNDLLGYFKTGSDLAKENTPEQFVDSMVQTLKDALKKIHSVGARKFVIAGVGAIGCCPAMRNQNKTAQNQCDDEANQWSVEYNRRLNSMLPGLKSELKNNMDYSYVDIFAVFTRFLQTPATYGFTEVKAACCGLGNLRADVPCLPIAKFCSNRTSHVFWDLYHPTETAARIFVDTVYGGSAPYAMPINVGQLIVV